MVWGLLGQQHYLESIKELCHLLQLACAQAANSGSGLNRTILRDNSLEILPLFTKMR